MMTFKLEQCVYIDITMLTIASSVLSPRQWCEVPCAHLRGHGERCAHPGRGRPEPARPPAVRSLAAASQQHQQLRGGTHRACQQISPGRSCREGGRFKSLRWGFTGYPLSSGIPDMMAALRRSNVPESRSVLWTAK